MGDHLSGMCFPFGTDDCKLADVQTKLRHMHLSCKPAHHRAELHNLLQLPTSHQLRRHMSDQTNTSVQL